RSTRGSVGPVASQKLEEYRRKRDPKETSEPFGTGKRRGKQPIFVIQRHDARRLHYDFRLERQGALASWAVPKGVPLESGQRELRGRDPEGPVRRRSGRDLGPRDLRAGRREEGRRPDRPAPWKAPRRHVDARAGEARRRSEKLAADQEARGWYAGASEPGVHA